jgi:hypothetical protein
MPNIKDGVGWLMLFRAAVDADAAVVLGDGLAAPASSSSQPGSCFGNFASEPDRRVAILEACFCVKQDPKHVPIRAKGQRSLAEASDLINESRE